MRAGALEPLGHQQERLAFAAHQVAGGDAHAIERQFEGLPAEVADLGNRRASHARRKAAAFLLDHEAGNAFPALVRAWRRRGAGEQDQVVGAVGKGAPVLVAGQHPFVAVALGPARDRGQIRAGVGLRQRTRVQEFAADHARQIGLPHVLGHGLHDPAPLGARDDGRDRHPAARQLLADQAVLEDAKAEAAVLLRNRDAEIPHLRHLVAQIHGDLGIRAVEGVGDGQHLLHGELARRLPDHLALFRHVALAVCRYGHALVLTRFERLNSITASPRWLVPRVCQVTMP